MKSKEFHLFYAIGDDEIQIESYDKKRNKDILTLAEKLPEAVFLFDADDAPYYLRAAVKAENVCLRFKPALSENARRIRAENGRRNAANVKGKLSDERYATLSESLENEQKELKARLPEIETDLNRQADQEEGLQRFVSKAKQITNLKELTPELVHEFIEKIVVHAPKYLDGKRYQLIDIYFYGVGIVKKLEPEEMETEFQKALKQEKSA